MGGGKTYFPYFLIFLFSFILSLLLIELHGITVDWYYYLPVGFLPSGGPGTYWVLMYFSFILISPILYRLKESMSVISLYGLMLLLDVSFELATNYQSGETNFFYNSCLLRYFSCVGLGILLKKYGVKTCLKRMWIFMILSAAYLYLVNYSKMDIGYPWNFRWKVGENFYASFYSLGMVCVFLLCFKGLKQYWFLYWGRITYHIFLFQILWFKVTAPFIMSYPSILRFTINLLACFAGGYLLKVVSGKLLNVICKK